MKQGIKPMFVVMVLCGMSTAATVEDTYRPGLQRAHDRLMELEIQRSDYRLPKAQLTPELEKERFLLVGQLTENDPLWVVVRDLEENVAALAAERTPTAADREALDQMKDLLAVLGRAVEMPNSREEATEFATALRRFIVRRDVDGANAWVKQREKR